MPLQLVTTANDQTMNINYVIPFISISYLKKKLHIIMNPCYNMSEAIFIDHRFFTNPSQKISPYLLHHHLPKSKKYVLITYPSQKVSPYLALAAVWSNPEFDSQIIKTRFLTPWYRLSVYVFWYETDMSRLSYGKNQSITRVKTDYDSFHTCFTFRLGYVL